LMFLLLLMGLGAVGVKAQVRIGGNAAPNAAAALDLNATDATNTGTKTLALPRVSLASTTDLLGNASLLTGMLVYNTNTTLGAGVFFWEGSKWMSVSTGSEDSLEGTLGSVTGLNGTYRTWCFPASNGLGCWMLDNSKEGTPTATTYPGQAAGARGYYYDISSANARTGQAYNSCPPSWKVPSLFDLLALNSYLGLHPNSPFSTLFLDPATFAGVWTNGWTGWGTLNHLWSTTHYGNNNGGWQLAIWVGYSGVGMITTSYYTPIRCMKLN